MAGIAVSLSQIVEGVLHALLFPFGAVGFVVAFLVGSRAGGSRARYIVLATAGPILAFGLLALHARDHGDLHGCHDCTEGFGGAYHPRELLAAVLNSATSWLGLLVSSRRRRMRDPA